MKKQLKLLSFVFMAMMATFTLTACGSDDDGNSSSGDNNIINFIVGTWTDPSTGAKVTFKKDYTGSTSATFRHINGNFKYSAPYKVEKEDGEVWFIIDITYTDGDTDWEIGYKEDTPNKLIIEGVNLYKQTDK